MMNKRFVLDTNILISALLVKNSQPFQAIQLIENKCTILYSEATLSEIHQVLNRKKFDKYLTEKERQEFIIKFVEKSELVTITKTITICRDPKDDKFLELAVNGKADIIITGDQDLLVLNPFRNIEIVTVNDFIIRFNQASNN